MTAGAGKPTWSDVEWDRIRARLDAIGRAITGEAEPAPERARRILAARARELARPVGGEPAGGFEAALFDLAEETYALEARYVWQVFRLETLALLPGAEPPVFGVTAWRGTPLTILDLRRVLGLPGGGLSDLSHVVLLGAERPAFGVLADGVREVVWLAEPDVREPAEGVAARREYIRGITREAVLVLDAEELLRRHAAAEPRARGDAGGE